MEFLADEWLCPVTNRKLELKRLVQGERDTSYIMFLKSPEVNRKFNSAIFCSNCA